MKIINVSGFGNTGCTAQADFLTDHEGVAGILTDPDRNKNVLKAPYQEFGILKCKFTLGGLIISKLNNHKVGITKNELRASMKGNVHFFSSKLEESEQVHMEKRHLLKDQYGEQMDAINDLAVDIIPSNFEQMTVLNLLPYVSDAMQIWLHEISELVSNSPELVSSTNGENIEILGLKNDPPGAYPLLASVIPNGITSSMLRDPRDTNVSFNEGKNGYGQNINAIRRHCELYNYVLDKSKQIIEKYYDLICPVFFVHDFENFVHSKSHREAYCKKMIGNRKRIYDSFNPRESAKNIGIYKKLPKEEIDLIEKLCMKKYLNFRLFLQDRNLLMD